MKLKLHVVTKGHLQINMFKGSANLNDLNEYNILEIIISRMNKIKGEKMSVKEIPKKYSEIERQLLSIIKHTCPQSEALEFGEDGRDSNGSMIEVLMGLYMYWEVVPGRFIKIWRKSVALQTVFGNTMSGPVDINPEDESRG